MIYPAGDPYGRSRYNPLAIRAMVVDKLRERLLGLIFVPEGPAPAVPPTLAEILAGRARGTLHDAYRQSWVASPEAEYVSAGNRPLQTPLAGLQAILDAPLASLDVKGKPVPTAASGLSDAERALLQSRGLLDASGQITPQLLGRELLDTPEQLLSPQRWDAIYAVPKGDVTIEHIQHAFYMAANYGYQILNGNFAAAIDDYELKLRFMNDLATYRINVSWLWALVRHQATITKDGHLMGHALTEDGVVLGAKVRPIPAGTRFTPELFEEVWTLHDQWTNEFFAELDRRGDPGRFDRSKAPLIMDLLRRQLRSPRYIQHSARALFVLAQAAPAERGPLLDALFELTREQLAERIRSGVLAPGAQAAHDQVHDLFPGR
jgi:malate synthase